jgi:hypothetical protein
LTALENDFITKEEEYEYFQQNEEKDDESDE